jgi:hypothetical protein
MNTIDLGFDILEESCRILLEFSCDLCVLQVIDGLGVKTCDQDQSGMDGIDDCLVISCVTSYDDRDGERTHGRFFYLNLRGDLNFLCKLSQVACCSEKIWRISRSYINAAHAICAL